MSAHYLDQLFAPRSIAVFGASEREHSVGGRVFDNLRKSGFAGPIYPINPGRATVFGVDCYPSVADIGEPVDLAVIATPAPTVPKIIEACGEIGVKAAIVVSAGFSEGEGKGAALERQFVQTAHHYGMRVMGPNCLGLIRPSVGMNATFSKNSAKPGHLALVSQSGALCTSILDWAAAYDIGFSALASIGDAGDIDFGDLLDFLAQDPETQSILLYVEGIRDARRFMSGLRVAARMKPVIVIKAGRHEEGSKAAVTHTGAIIGADDVFDAALQRAGAVRVVTIEQLFAAAQLLSTEQRVSGNRLAIVTNGGGVGVMAVDRAVDLGVKLAELSDETVETLNAVLPAHWSHGNPVDVLGDATPDLYSAAVNACLSDNGVDGVLVMLTPQAMTDPTECARKIVDTVKEHGGSKPVLTCWMGGEQVETAREYFSQHHFPTFQSPESSVEAFAFLASYARSQQKLMQVPEPLVHQKAADPEGARMIIEGVLADHRSVLSSNESKAVLRAFGIPVTQVLEADSATSALVAAESVGFPVAMKINSPDITHKSDVDGVRLNVTNAAAVRGTYHELVERARELVPNATIKGVTIEPMHSPTSGRELLVGVIKDPVFGPTVTFGAGGTRVEVLRDRAVGLPPLNKFLVEQMVANTKVSKLLKAFRGMPAVNMEALVQTLIRVSDMACEIPQITGLDINPLIADENGVIVVDARIVVERHAPTLDMYDHVAIHPYPAHLTSQYQLADGTTITIRPIRPEDAEIEQDFVRRLSPESKFFRFMRSVNELTHEMLVRFTQLDYHRELGLIAVLNNGQPDEMQVGVARYGASVDGTSCEFGLVVSDEWQHKGIGTNLMTALLEAAQQKGFTEMNGEILSTNHGMLGLVENLGFTLQPHPEDPGVKIARHRL
ncbi:MAG: bifunctional acetate--CoA ligase family protein/GNAT family N-acetyltransferase [Bacteroidetes bacterium]|nr:bifunctional acetate--CoA ligase family protein/GNAT family N-acetyltransferase [Bacteroidota bacterium]